MGSEVPGGTVAKSKTAKTKSVKAGSATKTKATYDAASSSNRRRSRAIDRRTDDWMLRPRDRDKLCSDARDLRRNYSVAAHAIRTHLDYVSTFHFQTVATSKVPAFAAFYEQLDKLMAAWQRAENCDVTGRYDLSQIIRMAEAARTVDGDVFVMKISDGRVQLIEADRVRNPSDNSLGEYTKDEYDPTKFLHGVRKTDAGRHVTYAICDRDGNSQTYTLRSLLPAIYAEQFAYVDSYDQVRGVTPLAAAINTFNDLYEAHEYALAKMKLAQLFGTKFTRAQAVEETDEVQPYSFDFGSGPQNIELDPDDKFEFLETHQPSTEFQAYMTTAIQMAIKALDIPYSFWSEDFTNYAGARQALLQYQQSANIKRSSVKKLLRNLTQWRISLWVLDGELELPAGMTLDDVQYQWVATGLPWIDPVKEAEADVIRVTNCLDSREDLCRERGKDFYGIVDKLAAENEYAKSKGIALDKVVLTNQGNANATAA